MPRVFLSYSRNDFAEVSRLRADLTAHGIEVWWDKDILPGQDWKYEIREAMKRSNAVILCLSGQCLERARSFIYPEVYDAISAYRERRPGEIFLIPVRFSECEIPSIEIDGSRTLDRLHFVDLFPPDRRDEGVRSILEALDLVSPQPDRAGDESLTGCDRRSESPRGKDERIADLVGSSTPQHPSSVTLGQPSSWTKVSVFTTALGVILLVLFLVGRPYLVGRAAKPGELPPQTNPHLPPQNPAILGGYIVDAEKGEPLPGVTLTIEDWETLDGRSPIAMTDAAGRFRFDNLRPSADTSQQVRLIARKPGYQASPNDPTLGSTTLPIMLRRATNSEGNP